MISSTIIGTDDLTLQVAKKHLNVLFKDDDEYIENLIDVSLNSVENYCRNVFILRENEQNIGSFVDDVLPSILQTENTHPPSDDKITIEYTSGGLQTLEIPKRNLYTLENSNYIFINGNISIFLKDAISIDTDTEVILKWKTGTIDKMETSIMQARLLTIGTFYENRESVTAGTVAALPYTIQFLLEAHMSPQIG